MNERKKRPRGSLTRHIQFGDKETAKRGAQLGSLMDRAPILDRSRKSRSVAMIGSLITCVTIGGLYFGFQIYQKISERSAQNTMIAVESAPEIKPTELKQLIEKVEEEELRSEEAYQRKLEELKSVNPFESTEPTPEKGEVF